MVVVDEDELVSVLLVLVSDDVEAGGVDEPEPLPEEEPVRLSLR